MVNHSLLSLPRITLLVLLLVILQANAAAGFFIQGTSLTWYIPKKEAIYRPTHSITKEDKSVYNVLSKAQVVDPLTGKYCQALDEELMPSSSNNKPIFPFFRAGSSSNGGSGGRKALVVVMPQLGDFDSAEYATMLKQVLPDLKRANIALRIIGIGNCKTAQMFSLFTGLPLECIRVDPTASVHSALQLHRGPNWDVPDWVPSALIDWFARDICGNKDNEKIPAKEVARSWLNYMAMCAGIAADGTLKEILRGYLGDKSAPEMLTSEDTVHAGPMIAIKGTSDVKIGPIQYQNWWKNEQGYLRPVELATVRLRSMVEVLTKFEDYVPDQRLLDWRGATFLLDESSQRGDKKPLYEHRNPGVLTYSETMPRPLSFLQSYIGAEKARNPLGLRDPDFQYVD
mmetsp:Transcript_68650/g.192434  ORF Transcript_68650/g.192434 Transcript_68650/m.192434 type:complete len:399 (+) Transcript_68650:88-1284(+)